MLRKWSVVVAAAVVLGSVGLAGAQGAMSATGQVSEGTSSGRKFQVNSREMTPGRDANGRRKTMGLAKVSVNDRASHRINVLVEQDLTGKAEHKVVIDDMTANLKLEYTRNAQTSAVTLLFSNSTVRVAAGPNGAWTVDDRPFPTTEAAAKALAQDGRLAGIAPELLGGLVIGLDVLLGAGSTAPRLDVAWQAAVAAKG